MMRDFAGPCGQEAVAPLRPGLEDGAQMTHQGYKRFQRRRNRRQDPLEEYARTHAHPTDAAAETASAAALPAPLPEPWDLLRRVPIGIRKHQEARSPLVNFYREDPAAKAFDLLRTRLLHTLKLRGWKRVAVSAPLGGCGTTFTAVNLALSLARVPGSRTILMDMNHRNPGVAEALKMEPSSQSADFLEGAAVMEDYLIRPAETLALGLAGAPGRNPAEVIHGPMCGQVLDDMVLRSGAGTVIYDLPPVLEYDDLAAFLPQVDGVLLVSDGTRNTAAHLEACEKMLAGHCELLGVVLNRARDAKGALFGR